MKAQSQGMKLVLVPALRKIPIFWVLAEGQLEPPGDLGGDGQCAVMGRRRARWEATAATYRDASSWEQTPWLTFRLKGVEIGYRLQFAQERVRHCCWLSQRAWLPLLLLCL